MVDQKKDFYQDLRSKMRDWLKTKEGMDSKWGEYLMFAPDLFHLLCKLSIDKDVPMKEKAKLAGAIAYFVSPIDLLPEALIGPLGFVDDISLAAYVINSIMNKTDPEVVKKHWAGEEDILEVVKKILKVADEMVGQGLWKKIKKLIDTK
jgi:uncharacterized membrane protein YkvA (DUF1232 family)